MQRPSAPERSSVALLRRAILAAFVVATIQADAADAAGPWRARSVAPFAVRGGVLAIELEPAAPPEQWTSEMVLELEDGTTVSAMVAVVVAAERPIAPCWTSPADPIRVLSLESYRTRMATLPAPQDAVVVALARMAEGYDGTISVGGTRVRPRWLEAPSHASGGATPPPLSPRDDRPDLESPGEWWRWTLLCELLDAAVPAPPFDGAAALYARHRAELWQAGLSRVRSSSPSVARELLELLAATVDDPLRSGEDRRIAAWISQPTELTSLLAILLDPDRDAASVMRAALGWMQSRTPLTVWLESDAGGQVVVAAANPLPEEIVVRCGWIEAPREAPVALLVPAQQVARLRMNRPAPAPRSTFDRTARGTSERWLHGLTLRLEAREWEMRLPVGPGVFPVRPPGLALSALMPALTLAAAQSRRIDPPPAAWRTIGSLRRLGRRWELFVECLRPQPSVGDRIEVSIRRPQREFDPRAPALAVSFTVDERGAITMLEGEPPPDLAAHARSHADRWRVRIELPDAWLPLPIPGDPERPLEVSVSRLPGSGHGRQTTALAVPSWRPGAPVRADLAAWFDLPQPHER